MRKKEPKNENLGFKITGEYEDRIFHNGKLYDVIKDHNLIVTTSTTLIASLLKGEYEGGSPYGRIAYWDVGTDDTAALVTDVACISPLYRKAISTSDISFLDTLNVVTVTPTNVIQIVSTFADGEGNGTWKEFSLHGGDVTAVASSGLAVNRKVHADIVKGSGVVVERRIKFTITLS